MATADASAEEVRKWLAERARLERYYEHLLAGGFNTLAKCALLGEGDLDKLGIKLPGHRKRLLLCTKDLKEEMPQQPGWHGQVESDIIGAPDEHAAGTGNELPPAHAANPGASAAHAAGTAPAPAPSVPRRAGSHTTPPPLPLIENDDNQPQHQQQQPPTSPPEVQEQPPASACDAGAGAGGGVKKKFPRPPARGASMRQHGPSDSATPSPATSPEPSASPDAVMSTSPPKRTAASSSSSGPAAAAAAVDGSRQQPRAIPEDLHAGAVTASHARTASSPPLPPPDSGDDEPPLTALSSSPHKKQSLPSPAAAPTFVPRRGTSLRDPPQAQASARPSTAGDGGGGDGGGRAALRVPSVPSRSSSVRRKPRQSPVTSSSPSPDLSPTSTAAPLGVDVVAGSSADALVSGNAVTSSTTCGSSARRAPVLPPLSEPSASSSNSTGAGSSARQRPASQVPVNVPPPVRRAHSERRTGASAMRSSQALGVAVLPVLPKTMAAETRDADRSQESSQGPPAGGEASSLRLATNGRPPLPPRNELEERSSTGPPVPAARGMRSSASQPLMDSATTMTTPASQDNARKQSGQLPTSTSPATSPKPVPPLTHRSSAAGMQAQQDSQQPRDRFDTAASFRTTAGQEGASRSRRTTTVSVKSASAASFNRQGYLWKSGKKEAGAWRHRWCVLNGYYLKYYTTKDKIKEEDAKGRVAVRDMRSIQLEYVPSDTKHQYRLLLDTPERTYFLATEDEVDAGEWVQAFRTAIDACRPNVEGAEELGGHMANPDKQGHLMKQGHGLMADWKRRYVALKGHHFCYYNSTLDFRDDKPIHEISMVTASARPSPRNRFQLITPNRTYEFQCDDAEEQGAWIQALQDGIMHGLSDLDDKDGGTDGSTGASRAQEIIAALQQNPANKACADCGEPNPTWASCNLVVTVCIDCSGIHRSLGVSVSKVRSLELDVNMWQDDLVELFSLIGNGVANEYWLTNCRSDPIDKESEMLIRDSYIRSKYAGAWCDRNANWEDKDVLTRELATAVKKEDLVATYRLLVAGASTSFEHTDLPEGSNTAMHVATETGNRPLIELVSQFHRGRSVSTSSSPDAEGETEDSTTSGPTEKFRMTGHLSKRGQGSSTYRKRWFTLDQDCTELAYHREGGEEAGTIDLRKMSALQRDCNEDTFSFSIVTPERTYQLQAETKEDMETWCGALNSSLVIGVHMSIQKLAKSGIPWLVENCLIFIEANGMESEGLYRISGRKASMEKLKASFNADAQGVVLDLNTYSVHDVTGTLKDYFRKLPEPLLTAELYPQVTATAEIANHDDKLLALRDCLCQLPAVNYYTLKRMIGHLVVVANQEAHTKMPITNLSMIFGPTLMTTEHFTGSGLQGANLEFQVISLCITYYKWLFQISEAEQKEADRMKEAIDKMRKLSEQQTATNNVAQNFIVGIYLGPVSYGRTVSATISSKMTALSLLQSLSERNVLPLSDTDQHWPYLCLHGDDLRRPLSRNELVLSTCMGWPVDVNAKLAMFSDEVIVQVMAKMGKSAASTKQLSVMVQTKEKDKKGKWGRWQKRFGVLRDSKVTLYKDAAASTLLSTIDMASNFVYLGSEQPRVTKPPTQFSLTFMPRSSQNMDEAKCLCLDDSDTRLAWLATIYSSLDTQFAATMATTF